MKLLNENGVDCSIGETSHSLSFNMGLIETLIESENLLQHFKKYLFTRYVKDDARLRYSYTVKYGKQVLENPMFISELSPSQAKHLLRGLAAFRDYLETLGYWGYAAILDLYLKQLRKIAPRSESVKILEYEYDQGLVEKALNELRRLRNGYTWRLVALTCFFTGLRGPEIVYLVNNIERLRKIVHRDIVIVELGYVRKSKKAWITMLPKILYDYLLDFMRRGNRITYNTIVNLKDKAGIHVSIMRKAHLTILSKMLQQHEIDLLQGRVGSIIVKHYTKHLREIAEKYHKAYKEYLGLIHEILKHN